MTRPNLTRISASLAMTHLLLVT